MLLGWAIERFIKLEDRLVKQSLRAYVSANVQLHKWNGLLLDQIVTLAKMWAYQHLLLSDVSALDMSHLISFLSSGWCLQQEKWPDDSPLNILSSIIDVYNKCLSIFRRPIYETQKSLRVDKEISVEESYKWETEMLSNMVSTTMKNNNNMSDTFKVLVYFIILQLYCTM